MGDDQRTGTVDELVATSARWTAVPPPDVACLLGNLVQAYAIFSDRAQRDELAGLFTMDATWDGTELGYGVAEGPDAIAETVLAHFDATRPMVHLPGPPILVGVSDSEVHSVSWCLATRSSGDGAGPTIYFHYHDVIRREGDGGWRFHRRTLHLRFRAGTD